MKLTRKQKSVVWWVSLPLIVLFGVTYQLIALIPYLITQFFAQFDSMFSNLMMRYEMWTVDTPKGYFMNCPYKQTLKQAWEEGKLK